LFADTDPNALGQVWAFIIFPLIGSAVGVLLYRFINDTTAD
jgi:glycerol uptake facilitator-like aquaporin